MRIRRWSSVLMTSLTCGALCLTAVPATPSQADSSTAQDQTILVTFDSAQGNASRAAKSAVERSGGSVTSVRQLSPKIAAVTVRGTSSGKAAVEARTADQPGVKAAEAPGRVYPTSTNDAYYSYLWNLNNSKAGKYGVDAEDAWKVTRGGGSVIAILDTGIASHPDLTSHVVAGYDFVDYDPDPTDEGPVDKTEFHGTHVAGIAAAIANNGIGVAGVAPEASIEPVRVMGADGGDDVSLVEGLTWAAGLASDSAETTNDHPADVINLSLGSEAKYRTSCPSSVQTAINDAVAAGSVVVVATGNENTRLQYSYPANCKNVIRVAASGNNGKRASYSNYGTAGSYAATISAPGGSASSATDGDRGHWIWSTWTPDNSGGYPAPGYMAMVGTSMAAPHVAGVVALMRAASPNLTVAQITRLLTSTAEPLANSCGSSAVGSGIVDASAAVAAAASTSIARSYRSGFSVSKVSISGTRKVGKTLKAKTVSNPTASSLTYQWIRNGIAIPGATKNTYKLKKADKRASIQVKVAAGCGSRSAVKTSAKTAKVK